MVASKAALNAKQFLSVFVIVIAIAVPLALNWGFPDRDHLGAISLDGNEAWYRDVGGRSVPELNDLDIFYHNIGQSIENARTADIVILGPSFVLFALDDELMRSFADRHHIKIYDMSFLGVRSGEFSREIVERWGIRPKLWIINADDQVVHFFSPSLDLYLGAKKERIPAVGYGRFHGFLTVAYRNLRWRLEDASVSIMGYVGRRSAAATGIYRRIDDGSLFLGLIPRYTAATNPTLHIDRNQDCHASAETMEIARHYVTDVGSHVVLMLVPHSQYCPQQVRELATGLEIEAIIPSTVTAYTTVDGGGHLDHNGAVAFTKYFLSALEDSDRFRQTFPQKSTARTGE
jgi:hypothetical protein